MPRIVLFREASGRIPIVSWLESMPKKAMESCLARIDRLRRLGHALRRPEADSLRDGIHELRVRSNGINYRILYFFHGPDAVVLSHGIMKQRSSVPVPEIALAIKRRIQFRSDPDRHSHEESL